VNNTHTICPGHIRRRRRLKLGRDTGKLIIWRVDCAKIAPHVGKHCDSAGKEFS
jgi:hypothetical protein